MKKMNRMLLREIWKAKGQFIAAASIIFAGISIFLAAYMSFENLKNSADHYYKNYHFMDYSASAPKITPDRVKEISRIQGVNQAIGRLSRDVTGDMGGEQRVVLRVTSVPDNAQPAVNKLYVNSGSYFKDSDSGMCLVNKQFASYYGLKPGDQVHTIINAQKFSFTIQGVVSSPEFVDAVKSESDFSEGDFGVLYLKETEAGKLLGMEGLYNQVHVTFQDGAKQKEVIAGIEAELKPDGFMEGTKRENQLSFVMLNNDIDQVQELAVVFPLLFLLVAAAVIYITQKRMVANQRTLIGVMKAMGYSKGRILGHYVLHALVVALAGGGLAIITGILMGRAMTSMYTTIHNIPVMYNKVYWGVVAVGVGLCTAFSVVAGYNAAKRIIRLVPAQALRSEPPRVGKRIFLERVGFLWPRLSFGWKVSIRNIFRSRSRTLFTALGAVFTVMIFIVVLFLMDSINYTLDYHFKEFQKQDYKVNFSKPLNLQQVKDLLGAPGIWKVETLLEVPVRISRNGKVENTVLVALEGDESLYKLETRSKKKIELSGKGIVVSRLLADRLSLEKGDTVTLRSELESDESMNLTVDNIENQVIGESGYMNRDVLFAKFNSPAVATSALITVDPAKADGMKKLLYQNSEVDSLEGRLESYNTFQKYMKFLYVFIGAMIIFGSIMGFATIYNTTVINIGERRRELASLKVLGYKRGEIENTIFRENMFIAVLSIIPGLILGRVVSGEFAKQMNSQNIIMDVILSPRTYIITIASLFLFIILSQLANRRNISGLNMVEVLNNREG